MEYTSIIYAVGATGIFPSRAFMPAFVTSVMLRFGPQVQSWAGVGLIPKEPVQAWFTSDAAILLLGVLTVLEFFATKDGDIRQAMDQFDHWLKSGMVLLSTFGVLSAADTKVMHAIQGASMAGDGILAAAAASGVFWLADMRRKILELLAELDEDNSLGLQSLAGWCEDGWVCFAILGLFVFPLLMLFLMLVVSGLLMLVRKWLERREENTRITCANCSALIYPCAPSCPGCRHPNATPCDIGFFGTSKPGITAGPEHSQTLREKKRCPACATRLRERRADQACPECGTRVFADATAVAAYDNHLRRRLGLTTLVAFLLGMVPVAGLVAGVIWYRIQVVAPYRRYLPPMRCFWLRLLLGLVNLLLAIVQWVPLAGWASVPLMAWLSHTFFRRAFLKSAI